MEICRKYAKGTRKYTDYGFARAFAKRDFKVIWNNKFLNRIRKVDLPSIYHTDFMDQILNGYSMNPNYFGKINNGETPAGDGVRLLMEQEFDDGFFVLVHISVGFH